MPARFQSPHVTAEGEHLGYPWAIITVPRMGHFCAYVGVPREHPWYGCDDNRPPQDLDVHGGVTYGHVNVAGDTHWLGWDYAHAGDFMPYYAEKPGSMPWSEAHDKRWTLDEVTAHALDACRQAKEAMLVYPADMSPTQQEWARRITDMFRELDLPSHMLNGVTEYLLHGNMPGGFLTSVLCNDYAGAFSRADEANVQAMRGWLTFPRYLPSDAFGSRAAVDAWAKHQGLKYQERG